MADADVPEPLNRWSECRDCGLFQQLPHIADGEAALCIRCDALLRRAGIDRVTFARASAVAAALLFVLALCLPLVDLDVHGRSASSSLLSSSASLSDRGFPGLGLVVLATLVLLPATQIALQLVVLFGASLPHPPRWLAWLFGWLRPIGPWAMMDVFLLGSFVAYTRLKALAHVDVRLGALALAAAIVCMVATDATLDREAIWQTLEDKAPGPPPLAPTSSEGDEQIACDACGAVARARPGERCRRCRHRLRARRGSIERTWAFVVTAALLYVPANVLPVMTVKRMAEGGPTTIANGVIELVHNHLWPLAVLVLLASIVLPVVKIVSLAVMLLATHRRSAWRLRERTKLFRLLKAVGRWSMIDIFALAVLVGVVRFGLIALVLPGMGAVAFCAVIFVTMMATEMFDPRRMWDAADAAPGAALERAHGGAS